MRDGLSRLQLVLCGEECVTPAYQRLGLTGDRAAYLPETHGPRSCTIQSAAFFSHHEPIFLLWQAHLNFTGHFLTKNDELS